MTQGVDLAIGDSVRRPRSKVGSDWCSGEASASESQSSGDVAGPDLNCKGRKQIVSQV